MDFWNYQRSMHGSCCLYLFAGDYIRVKDRKTAHGRYTQPGRSRHSQSLQAVQISSYSVACTGDAVYAEPNKT